MVQQSQYHQYGPPTEETGSPAVQLPGKGRKPSRRGRKRLRQGLGQNPGLHRARRPVTAQQSQGPGTLYPASTGDKAEPTTRHPAALRGLEPGPPTAMTVLEQDLTGGRQAPGGAWQGAGGLTRPACATGSHNSSLGLSLATAWYGATLVPAKDGHRQRGESVLGAEQEPQSWSSPRPQPTGVMCWGCPSPPRCPQALAEPAGATSVWISASTGSQPTR